MTLDYVWHFYYYAENCSKCNYAECHVDLLRLYADYSNHVLNTSQEFSQCDETVSRLLTKF
jgi:hypothetical protein